MPRRSPEERATAAVDALVAKRDKLQADLDAVNALLQKLGVSIGAPTVIVDMGDSLAASENLSIEKLELPQKPKMAGEGPVSDEPAKDLNTLMAEAKAEDKFPTTIRHVPEPDYAKILAEDDDGLEEPEGLSPGDKQGAGRMA